MQANRILSIDGGGVFVLMCLILLRRIEEARPGFLAAADLLAGTSAGGLSAVILAAEEDPSLGLEKAIDFWEHAPILARPALHAIGGILGVRSLYSHTELRAALVHVLGSKCLRDLPRQVMVAAIQLDNRAAHPRSRQWQPRSLSNMECDGGAHLDHLAVDVALRSGAAPVVWPIYQGYVDGGLFANDPSMLALSRVLRDRQISAPEQSHARWCLDDITLFSLGEGQAPHYLSEHNAAWGYARWLFRPRLPLALVQLALDSTGEEISEQCRLLLGDNQYYRLNPDTNVPMGRIIGSSLWSTLTRWRHEAVNEVHDPLADTRQKARALGEGYDLTATLEWLDRSSWLARPIPAAPPSTT